MLHKITNIGVPDTLSNNAKRKHILFNQLNLVGALAFLLLAIADIVDINIKHIAFSNELFANYVIILLCFLHILLHKFIPFRILKSIPLFDVILVALFFQPLSGVISTNLYFWGPYAPVFCIVLPYMLYTNDAKMRNIVLVFYFTIILFYDQYILFQPFGNTEMIRLIKSDYLFYKVIPIVAFVFINFTMLYFTNQMNSLRRQLQESHDILEQKNSSLEEVIKEKNKILKIIGHDLRNSMSGTVQIIDIIKSSYRNIEQEKFFAILDAMKISGERGLKLLSDLIEWSKLRPTNIKSSFQLFRFKDITKKTIELLTLTLKNKHIKLHTEIQENVKIFGNKRMIEAVIRNLISNAIKFSYEHGEIELTAKQYTQSIQICVEDKGVGISPKTLKTLFTDSHNSIQRGTNNEEGTGLGLIFCKEFIQSHNGRIWAESEKDVGSKFFISIPNSEGKKV